MIDVVFYDNKLALKPNDSNAVDKKEQELLAVSSQGNGRIMLFLGFYDYDFDTDSLRYLQHLARAFISKALENPSLPSIEGPEPVSFSRQDITRLVRSASPAIHPSLGKAHCAETLLQDMNKTYMRNVSSSGETPLAYLTRNLKGRVSPSGICFNLAETKDDTNPPFAFFATYATLQEGELTHIPLRAVLSRHKSDPARASLLLELIKQVAEQSSQIASLLKSGQLFSPIYLEADEAYSLLCEVPLFEKFGIACRIPAWSRDKTYGLGFDEDARKVLKRLLSPFAIAALVPRIDYHGLNLTKEDIELLLAEKEGLALLKGEWTIIDHDQLSKLLEAYNAFGAGSFSLADAYRELAALQIGRRPECSTPKSTSFDDWSRFIRNVAVEDARPIVVPRDLAATLRPYQVDGFRWLCALTDLGFGACLADDMGLGKTVQTIAWLARFKENGGSNVLLVVPPTLIDNWAAELEKFAPSLTYQTVRTQYEHLLDTSEFFLTITSYQVIRQHPILGNHTWSACIIDEAQAIKNHRSKQSLAIRALDARLKIALSGTPLENNPVELWTLFDFLNPGLLGSYESFRTFCSHAKDNLQDYSVVRSIISPFILRRRKTDKSVIPDLPEKTEVIVPIELTTKQSLLYHAVVKDFVRRYSKTSSTQILSLIGPTIIKLKQICNHPSQYTGEKTYRTDDSGKFIALRQICEEISERGEKVLVFTQFSAIIPALNALLSDVFQRPGETLSGKTPMAKRHEIVSSFQNGKLPYLVLSLKVGGLGLNLTEATNVIHFDRWWNPAVEDQATDRVYRIGQTQNVFVYKFMSNNTVEELIDATIRAKQQLASVCVGDSSSSSLNLTSKELLDIILESGRRLDE